MSPYLILIPILVPILCGAAVFALPIRRERTLCAYAEAAACVTAALTVFLLLTVRRETAVLYSFAGNFSIDLHVDGLSALFAGMISLMWPPALLYAFEYMKDDRRKRSFFAFYVISFGITLGVAFSGNILTMYVFFEMLTLVTIPLVTHYQNHESMFAGRKYAAYVIGGASLAFIAVVMATIDGGTGTFLYGGNLGGTFSRELMRVVFLFGFFGFGAKAAVFPLSGWLPTASAAPTPVTALLHAVAVVNTGVFAVTRLTWYTYGAELIRGTWTQNVCLGAAAFTLVYAAVLAVRERHFKRRLAWSTVSNLSYMLFGILLLTPAGLAAGLSHMVFHGIIKMSLFLCAGAFMHVTGCEYLYEINGVGRRMPWTFAFYTLGALSLTGIPLFCGFVSKWQLLSAGAELGTPMAVTGVICLIVSAFLCALYTISVSVRAFFPFEGKNRWAGAAPGFEGGWRMLVPIGIFSAANVLFGLFPQGILNLLEKIAQGAL